MNRQIFRSTEHGLGDSGESICIDRRMASLSVDACEGSAFSLRRLPAGAKSSFDHIISSHRSYSVDVEEREDFGIPVFRKLSASRSREIPFRDIATDSRDPENEEELEHSRADNDERTEAASASVNRLNQDIFNSRSPTSENSGRDRDDSLDSNSGTLWASVSSLKRANPIYESDNEFDEFEDSHPSLRRKRRCSMECVTAVYWQHELKSTDE